MKFLSAPEPFTESDQSLLSSGAWAPTSFNATADDPLAGLRPASADANGLLWIRVPVKALDAAKRDARDKP